MTPIRSRARRPRLATVLAAATATVASASLAAPLTAQHGAQHGEDREGHHHAALHAHAVLIDAAGDSVGSVRLTETPHYGVHFEVRVSGLSPGEHALHVHETGACEAPGFQSAGGHYAPRGHAHGILHHEGKHAGDLLNLHVPSDGSATSERLAPDLTLAQGAASSLFDEDGSALVIHQGADDYRSQPSGAAGDRVACGVVRR